MGTALMLPFWIGAERLLSNRVMSPMENKTMKSVEAEAIVVPPPIAVQAVSTSPFGIDGGMASPNSSITLVSTRAINLYSTCWNSLTNSAMLFGRG